MQRQSRPGAALRRRAFLTALFSGALPAAAPAQWTVRELVPPAGRQVRVVTNEGRRVTGKLAAVEADSLRLTVVDRRGRLGERVVQSPQIRALWVSRGRSHSAGALRGLWTGPLVGLTLGAIIGASKAFGEYGCEMCPRGRVEGAFLVGGEGLILGVPLGLAVGTLVGVERWERRWPTSARSR
jgi:hypothetical protein